MAANFDLDTARQIWRERQGVSGNLAVTDDNAAEHIKRQAKHITDDGVPPTLVLLLALFLDGRQFPGLDPTSVVADCVKTQI